MNKVENICIYDNIYRTFKQMTKNGNVTRLHIKLDTIAYNSKKETARSGIELMVFPSRLIPSNCMLLCTCPKGKVPQALFPGSLAIFLLLCELKAELRPMGP